MKTNVKRAVVALGIAVPLGVFWAAREAASWRPVKVGYEPVGWREVVYSTELRDDVFLQTPFTNPYTGTEEKICVLSSQLLGTSTIDNEAAVSVHLIDHKTHRTIASLRDQGKNQDDVDASLVENHSKLFLLGHLSAWVWDLKSKQLLHYWNLMKSDEEDVHLASIPRLSNGGLITQAMGPRIRVWSAETGRLVGTSAHLLTDFHSVYGEHTLANYVSFSPNGKFCFYDTEVPDYNSGPSHIALCQSGQTVWKLNRNYHLGFGGDDQTVLAQWEPTHVVEVRDIQNGQLLHKLKIRPGCTFLGSSADGNTLYTHNDAGEVFRQRIR